MRIISDIKPNKSVFRFFLKAFAHSCPAVPIKLAIQSRTFNAETTNLCEKRLLTYIKSGLVSAIKLLNIFVFTSFSVNNTQSNCRVYSNPQRFIKPFIRSDIMIKCKHIKDYFIIQQRAQIINTHNRAATILSWVKPTSDN